MVERDYVTVNPTVNPRKFCVVVMRYKEREDEYVPSTTSTALPKVAADALARGWAAALQLEIR